MRTPRPSPLASKLSWLGERVSAEYEARKLVPTNEEKITELHKLTMVALRDAERYISHFGPFEVQVATNCFAGFDCDIILLKALAVVFCSQLVHGDDQHPTLAELYQICRDVHEEPHEGFFRFRSLLLDDLIAGLFSTNRNAFFHSSAVLRLSPRILYSLVGGQLSGLARLKGER